MRDDPCVITIPDDAHPLCVATSMFLQLGFDIIALGEDCCEDDLENMTGYLGHLRSRIGLEISDDEISCIQSATGGDCRPLTGKRFPDNTPAAIAKRMVDVTKYTCHLTKNDDGDWVGDCEVCYKRLGRNCPVAIWVRNRHCKLITSLDSLRKVPVTNKGLVLTSSSKGNMSSSYTSGHGKGGKRHRPRHIQPMVNDPVAYLSSLSRKTKIAVIEYLSLLPHVDSCSLSKGMNENEPALYFPV